MALVRSETSILAFFSRWLVFLGLSGLGQVTMAGVDDPSKAELRVVISARAPPAKTLEPFAAERRFIDTVVSNVGAKPASIVAWTQYGWSWMSNSAQVSPGIEALKNASETIILEPGQSFARAVEVYVVGARPVTFRLGFVAKADTPVSARVPPVASSSITWSNPLTLRR